jgi:hypothetical protein
MSFPQGDFRGDGHRFGQSPHTPHQLTGHGPDHLVGVLPAGDPFSGPLTAPHLGLPAEVLDGCGGLCPSAVERPADLRRIARRPRAVHQGATGMGVASCGARPVAASLARGGCRGHQPHAWHPCAGGSEAGAVAACGHPDDGPGARHAAPGRERGDHRVQAPRCDLRVACLVEPREACGVCGHGADVCLTDEGLRRGRTDHLREPSARGRLPGGPAGGADRVSQHKSVETARGSLKLAAGRFARPRESAHDVIVERGDLDRGESPRACQASPWHGGSAVRCDAVTGLLGQPRRRHHPAVVACFRQLAGEPVATRASFLDTDEGCGLGGHVPAEVVEVTLAGAAGDDLGVMVCGAIGHGHRVGVDSHADRQRARLVPG